MEASVGKLHTTLPTDHFRPISRSGALSLHPPPAVTHKYPLGSGKICSVQRYPLIGSWLHLTLHNEDVHTEVHEVGKDQKFHPLVSILA